MFTFDDLSGSLAKVRCAHCNERGERHACERNPYRPNGCPGKHWPTWVGDSEQSLAKYDSLVKAFWTERDTTYKPRT